RRFLSAMLERVQPEISKLLRLGMGVDGDHATFIAKFVGNQHLASLRRDGRPRPSSRAKPGNSQLGQYLWRAFARLDGRGRLSLLGPVNPQRQRWAPCSALFPARPRKPRATPARSPKSQARCPT